MNIKTELTMADFVQMEELEKRYYTEEHITPAAEAYEWYIHRPYSILALEQDDCIIGFMNLFPVRQEIFAQIEKGSFNDKYLTYEDIIQLPSTGVPSMNLFLSCVVIHEQYRKSNALSMLLTRYAAFYNSLQGQGTDIGLIAGDAVTPAGERFFTKIGLKRRCASDHVSTIYHGTYNAFVDAVSKLQR